MTHLLFKDMQRSPFDILVKNFFDNESTFDKPTRQVVTHPIDVYETKEGLTFEVACTGLDKNDVDINVEGDTLRVSHETETKESDGLHHTYHSGIRRSSFNLGWRISRRFDLTDIKAEMKNGLLTLSVPYSEESKPKSIKIK
jgi:HSP20 family protein|tara:strand:+ start:97 stop:522 length:426 start_codon:yes stop_codon:yes gene_type:complete